MEKANPLDPPWASPRSSGLAFTHLDLGLAQGGASGLAFSHLDLGLAQGGASGLAFSHLDLGLAQGGASQQPWRWPLSQGCHCQGCLSMLVTFLCLSPSGCTTRRSQWISFFGPDAEKLIHWATPKAAIVEV